MNRWKRAELLINKSMIVLINKRMIVLINKSMVVLINKMKVVLNLTVIVLAMNLPMKTLMMIFERSCRKKVRNDYRLNIVSIEC